jgi:hypothetical protein
VPGGAKKTTWDVLNWHGQMTATANGKSSGEVIVENKIYKNDWLLFYGMCKE